MELEIHYHKNADDVLDKKVESSIMNVLKKLDFKITPGCGPNLRKEILTNLKNLGWTKEVTINTSSNISLTSSFDKNVLCIQTGNMGRFYADLLKLQYTFVNKKAEVAIYIIPSKEASRKIGSNIAHFDRLKKELVIFENIITTPILVIGLK